MDWQNIQRKPEDRSEREFRGATRRVQLRDRLDIVLLTAAAVTLIVIVGGYWSLVEIGDRLGWFDAPVIQPLGDERILTNVRDNLPAAALLDAVIHGEDGHVYISQTGGVIHRYDPATHLWSTKTPFGAGEAVDDDFVLLRSGCGADLYAESVPACPDAASLWALGSDGSLVRRRNGDWEVIVSNTRFVGVDGAPVEAAELTTAAVSADDEWLIVGTQTDGVGVYHIPTHTWVPQAVETQQALAENPITHTVFWDGVFWLGSAEGVAQLTVSTREIVFELDRFSDGRVLDLAVDHADPDDNHLWILEERACTEQGNGCLRLSNRDDAGDTPRILIDERNRFPDLSLNELTFAQLQGEVLVLAGPAGIYRYDNTVHAWDRLFDKHVTATLPETDGRGFFYSFEGGIGWIDDGEVVRDPWEFTGEQTAKLMHGDAHELLIWTTAGNLYTLDIGGDEIGAVYRVDESEIDPATFTSAVEIQDTVLFLGRDGALLHNTRTRRYEDIPEDVLPAWIRQPETQLITVAEFVYAVTRGAAGSLDIYTFAAADMLDSSYYIGGHIDAVTPVRLPGPATRVWRWGESGIGVLAGDGAVYRISSSSADALTGEGEPALDDEQLGDIVQIADELTLLTDQGLRRYGLTTRSWEMVRSPLDNGSESVTDLVVAGADLLLRTSLGRLLDAEGNGLIGDASGFAISDESLSDARLQNDALYLAGDGRVERYSLAARAIDGRWETGSGTVRLHAIIDDEPLAQSGDRLYFGSTPIDGDAGAVVSVSVDGERVWTVRRAGGVLYWKGYDRSRPTDAGRAICYFRAPQAAGGSRAVYDARELPDGLIAVATAAGVQWYRPTARTWHSSSDETPRAERLYLLGDSHLLLAGAEVEGVTELAFVSLGAVREPDSCSTTPIATPVEATARALSYAVDEQSGRVVWVEADGEIREWRSGRTTQLLPAEGQPPSRSQLRRIYDMSANGFLLMTTNDTIWRYDLAQRSWREVRVTGTDDTLDLNIERSGGAFLVSARSQTGQLYLGDFDDRATSVAMTRVWGGNSDRLDADGEDILDVQDQGLDGDWWTFVLQTGVRYYNPVTRSWQQGLTFARDGTARFQQFAGRGVVVAEGGNVWYVARERTDEPSTFARYTLDRSDPQWALAGGGTIWRLTRNGELLRCTASGQAYACENERRPFIVERGSVLHAYEIGDKLLLEFADGMSAFDTQRGEEVTLPEGLRTLHAVSATYRQGERLMMYSSAERILVVTDPQLQTDRYVDVDQPLRDRDGNLWSRIEGVLRRWEGSRFALVAGDVTPIVLAQSVPAGVTAARTPGEWHGGTFSRWSLSLPESIDVTAISGLVHGDDGWWVVTGQEVLRVAEDTCLRPALTPTPDPTGSGATVSDTLTIEPAPTPEPYPCLTIAQRFPTDGGDLVSAWWDSGRLTLVYASGQALTITLDAGGAYTMESARDPDLLPAVTLDDQWPALSGRVVDLPSGESAYDPVVQLEDAGQLAAIRQSGAMLRLDASGVIPTNLTDPFAQPSALNVDWLRWDRDSRSFLVAGGSGNQESYTRDAFVVNRSLLFEDANALLARSRSELYVANVHGVWLYPDDDLSLDAGVIFFPLPMPEQVEAAHGQLIADGRAYTLATSGVNSGAVQDVTFNMGDVTFTDLQTSGRVAVSLLVGGVRETDSDGIGFVWDDDRRGVALNGNEVLLQSNAGIHALSRQLTGFDPGPGASGRGSGTLHTDNGSVFLADGANWWELDGGSWRGGATNPVENRLALENGTWRWAVANGEMRIGLKGAVQQFAVLPDVLGFTSDQLLAATVWNGDAFAATQAFLEVGGQVADLAGYTAGRLAPVAVDRFETFEQPSGRLGLFSYTGVNLSIWDAGSGGFAAFDGSDPRLTRELVDEPRLRLRLENGFMVKEVRVDRIDGSADWVAFDFVERQFPFDYVTGAVYFDNVLYVGSAAGVAAYRAPSQTEWRALQALIDLRPAASGALARVNDLGIPESDPRLLQVRGSQLCIERSLSSGFASCANAGLLDRRLRVGTPFWQWVDETGRGLAGQYRESGGALAGQLIAIAAGRWPHDRIGDVMVCDGLPFTLWDGHWATVYGSRSLEIDDQSDNFRFDGALRRLICVDRPIELTGETVSSGAYLEDETGRVSFYDAGRWVTVDEEQLLAAIISYGDNPPILVRDRLRLRAPTEGEFYQFEQRSRSGIWRPVVWEEDALTVGWRVTLDSWQNVTLVDDQLWVATPAGLINATRITTTATLDLDQLLVVREPRGEPSGCRVTDLTTEASATWLRCDHASSRVYSGTLSLDRDENIFTMAAIDHFATAELIGAETSDYWAWSMVDRNQGQAGRLEAQLYDEAVEMTSGRFAFDALNSLALFRDGIVELGSSTGGWYEATRDGALPVAEFIRPIIPVGDEAVNGVGITVSGGERILCLALTGGGYRRIVRQPAGGYAVDSSDICQTYLGFDGVWQYGTEDGRLKISAPASIGGRADRVLSVGRFGDDIVIGVPATGFEEDAVRYYLPTSAGVVVLDADLQGVAIHGGTFAGTVDAAPPAVLVMRDATTPAYIGDAGFYTLDETRSLLVEHLFGMFSGARLLALGPGYGVSQRVRWEQPDGSRGWALMSADAPVPLPNVLVVDVGSFERYVERQAEWGAPPPLLGLQLEMDAVTFVHGAAQLRQPLPAEFTLLDALLVGKRVLLIGRTALFDIDLESAMGAVARGGTR